MLSLSRTRLLIGLAFLCAALHPAGSVRGQAGSSKSVSFETFDGVTISGTMYISPNPKRDAVVILLHSFDLKKGGSSQQEGWSKLAKELQNDGYHVLSFDFRGFGDSKKVSERFWKYQQNATMVPGAVRRAETIDHAKFNSAYLPYLINDIAAAKAYLDRRNDVREVNSSNVILIGAGEGAALGALWLKNESRRKRDLNMPPNPLIAGELGQWEVNDIACAVWLTINPGFSAPVRGFASRAIQEAGGKRHKVPMAFVYGKNDSKSATLADGYKKSISSSLGTKGLTGVHAVPGTNLAGNKLLGVDGTIQWILKDYLPPVMEARGNREQKDRKSEASQYWYVNPLSERPIKVSKRAGVECGEVDRNIVFQ
jgi:alpha-beta hydrolase superfamily lysophospholipase